MSWHSWWRHLHVETAHLEGGQRLHAAKLVLLELLASPAEGRRLGDREARLRELDQPSLRLNHRVRNRRGSCFVSQNHAIEAPVPVAVSIHAGSR